MAAIWRMEVILFQTGLLETLALIEFLFGISNDLFRILD